MINLKGKIECIKLPEYLLRANSSLPYNFGDDMYDWSKWTSLINL